MTCAPVLLWSNWSAEGQFGTLTSRSQIRVTCGLRARSLQKNPLAFTSMSIRGIITASTAKPKGISLAFVRETENVAFVEAVRILALKAGIAMPEVGKPAQKTLAYITCQCSCGKISEVLADKLEPFLGESLSSANALSLLPKLRCTKCGSPPKYILDDRMQQLFGPAHESKSEN